MKHFTSLYTFTKQQKTFNINTIAFFLKAKLETIKNNKDYKSNKNNNILYNNDDGDGDDDKDDDDDDNDDDIDNNNNNITISIITIIIFAFFPGIIPTTPYQAQQAPAQQVVPSPSPKPNQPIRRKGSRVHLDVFSAVKAKVEVKTHHQLLTLTPFPWIP